MIPLPGFINGIHDGYVTAQINEVLDHIDNLFAITDKLDTKQVRIQSLCIKYLSELSKETDTETLAHLTRQSEEIQNIKLYLYNFHTFVVKNIKAKPDDIKDVTQLLDKLLIQ